MAEEITKVIENVDELFPEIIVNGESHVSERYVESEATPSQSLPQSSEEQTEEPSQQSTQGEYVDTLELNGVEHDLKDSPLSAEVRALQELLSTIQSRLNELSVLIPSTATAQNQLADKNFVNSSVATNTANYISDNGNPFTSVSALEACSGTVTNNDYAFVTGTDSAGNVYYDRYKATVSGSTVTWAKEYRLNNSSFTAEQWATINSGITQVSSTVQDGDTNPVSSDAVYEALQSALSTPVNVVEVNNMHSVTSNAVYNFKPADATHADSATTAGSATTATSAGKLTTARKVYVKLGTASTSETKDFSGDTAIPVNGTLNVANGGTGATSLANITVGNSSKLGNVSVQTSSITEKGNHWSYITNAKFNGSATNTPILGTLKLSNGLIINWGRFTPSATSGTVTFLTAFTSANTYCVALADGSASNTGSDTGGYNYVNGIEVKTASTIKLSIADSGRSMEFIAIGY